MNSFFSHLQLQTQSLWMLMNFFSFCQYFEIILGGKKERNIVEYVGDIERMFCVFLCLIERLFIFFSLISLKQFSYMYALVKSIARVRKLSSETKFNQIVRHLNIMEIFHTKMWNVKCCKLNCKNVGHTMNLTNESIGLLKWIVITVTKR